MMPGKPNVVVGLFTIAGFIVVGFALVYLRDFAPGKEAWVASVSMLAAVTWAAVGAWRAPALLRLARPRTAS